MDIKCWNTRLNAQDLRMFTALVHTITAIGSKQSRKKRKRWDADFAKFGANLNFSPGLTQCVFSNYFFM
jgi:hypothetical protein